MLKALEWLIGALITTAAIFAFAWFGGPTVWQHLVDSENARKTAVIQASALKADTASASKAQANCAAEITASMKAATAIAAASKPVTQTGAEQPMLSAKAFQDALQ